MRPAEPIAARSAAPSTSAIIPPGICSCSGIAVRLAEAVVDDDDPDRAGRLRATRLRRERAGPAGDERDRAGQRVRGQRVVRAVRIRGAAAEVALHGLAVPADDRADVDERLVRARPGRRRRAAGLDRHVQHFRACAVERAERRREDLRVRDGGDGDRVRRRARRAGRAEAEVVAVVARGDDGHDARGGDVVDRRDRARRSAARPAARRRRS